MEYYLNLTIYIMGNYSKSEKRKRFLYESPQLDLLGTPGSYVLCMSGNDEGYTNYDDPNWFETN